MNKDEGNKGYVVFCSKVKHLSSYFEDYQEIDLSKKTFSGKDVYVIPVGFKSYAQYYYFKKQPNQRKEADSEDWLINGSIDKPAYFVAKITNKDYFDSKPECKFLKQDGGFLFYKRAPAKH